MGGVRWWNVKHPTAYAGRLAQGRSPAAGRETLDAQTRELERIMLATRLVEGVRVDSLTDSTSRVGREVAQLLAQQLIDPASAFRGLLVLTLQGRLLADAVVRRLLPD
jgi:oxygen-independent coproporphyrinogen-3 oxidase